MSVESKSYALAIELAPDFEEILDTQNLGEQIESLHNNIDHPSNAVKRDFGLGDVGSVAGLFVGLVTLIQQIRSGKSYLNEPDEKITERLIIKLSEETSLPPETREKLINKLIAIEFKLDE